MTAYSSGFLKRLARAALKDHWLTAVLIALVVNLPSLLVQGIAAVTGNDLAGRLQNLLIASMNAGGTAMDMNRFNAGLQEIRESSGIWLMQGMNAAAWLLTPCLTLGMTAWLLGRLRGQEDTGVTAVFSRMNLFLKGIGLRLYIALRIFLAMLPGAAVSLLSFVVLLRNTGAGQLEPAVLSAFFGLQTTGLIAMAVLGIMAALRYALGDMELADHPERGPVRAARASRDAMRGRRGLLFAVYISFLPWYLLVMMVSSLCLEMFGSIPALMVEMLGSLALSVYLSASVSGFYLVCEAGPEALRPGTNDEGGAEE